MNRVQDPQPKVMALRLYFPTRSRAAATRFWHHLSAPALAQHLLAAAKRAHVQQALLYQVASGFLKGERVTHHRRFRHAAPPVPRTHRHRGAAAGVHA